MSYEALEKRVQALEEAFEKLTGGTEQDIRESLAHRLREIADDLEEDDLRLPSRSDPKEEV